MALKKYPCEEVCAADAFRIDPITHRYQIDPEWCIVCEACMYECPIEAIYPNKYLIIQINVKLCVAEANGGTDGCKYW